MDKKEEAKGKKKEKGKKAREQSSSEESSSEGITRGKKKPSKGEREVFTLPGVFHMEWVDSTIHSMEYFWLSFFAFHSPYGLHELFQVDSIGFHCTSQRFWNTMGKYYLMMPKLSIGICWHLIWVSTNNPPPISQPPPPPSTTPPALPCHLTTTTHGSDDTQHCV